MLQRPRLICCLVLLAATMGPSRLTQAQVSAPFGGRSMSVEDERALRAKAKADAEAAKAAAGNGSKPEGEKKPGDDADKKKDGEGDKKDEEKEAEPAIITRPDKFEGKSTAGRLHEQMGADGLVHFNLHGVPWPDVLQWLADVSKLNFDWRELPGDYLNLRTQHGYTVEEARDVINFHLLARGFTLLKQGEFLTAENIKKLNQGIVPRVTPEGLDDRLPHDFVKVSFPLDWMLAAEAVEELKPMLSANGKLTALTSTNRLEAMDAVVNLREIRTVLSEEQSGPGQESLVQVFSLQHVKARDILPLLQEMVGLENHGSVTGNVSDNTGRQIMQQMQQMQQMLQQNANKPGGAGGGKPADDSKPKLIVNERENSILVNAAPDKMEIIAQAIQALDTPSRREYNLLQSENRMMVHRLSTLDPAPLVKILEDVGDLSPTTKLQIDEVNKSLIVIGPLADQVVVQTLVDKLDGSTRNFQVIPLRRLRAEEVAGTIMYMLGEQQEDKKNSRSDYYSSYYSYRYSDYNSQPKEEKRPFKVDADIEGNRLMIWANEVERDEVFDLLAKLGEIPSDQRRNETMRILDLSTDENAEEILDRIRRMWPNIAPNELEIAPQPQTNKDDSGSPAQEPAADTPPATRPSDVPAASVDLRSTSINLSGAESTLLLARSAGVDADWRELVGQFDETDAADEHSPDESRQLTDKLYADGRESQADAGISPTNVRPQDTPPVTIQRGPNGRIVLGSPDTEALNRIEDLIAELTPKRRDYVIFKLKHPNTWAMDVEWNLNEFFKQETSGDPVVDRYGYYMGTEDKSPSRLSHRKPLKIIGDEVSRTILVQGASQDQLRTIEELIDIYDQPDADNPQMVRKTRMFTVKYSNAYVVAEAIKDAYRDLLSPNDPAFEKKNGEDERSRSNATTITYDYGERYGNNDDEEGPPRPEPIRFKGALSMGVDEISNTIIVSAAVGLLNEIEQQIKELDELAKSANTLQVVPVNAAINLHVLQERMAPLLHVTRPQRNGLNGQQEGNPQGNGNGNRGNNNNGFGVSR